VADEVVRDSMSDLSDYDNKPRPTGSGSFEAFSACPDSRLPQAVHQLPRPRPSQSRCKPSLLSKQKSQNDRSIDSRNWERALEQDFARLASLILSFRRGCCGRVWGDAPPTDDAPCCCHLIIGQGSDNVQAAYRLSMSM
jgi:hypothetical protein